MSISHFGILLKGKLSKNGLFTVYGSDDSPKENLFPGDNVNSWLW